MKTRYFKTLATVLIISAVLVACGKDKDSGGGSNNNGYYCDQYGCYNTGNQYGYNNGYNDPYYYNPYQQNPNAYGNPATTVRLGGVIGITNNSVYKSMLDGWQDCRPNSIIDYSYCGLATSGNPYLEISVNDYKFSGTSKSSLGSLRMAGTNVSMVIPQQHQTTWKKLTNPDGFESRTTLPFQYGSAKQLVITVTGRSTDSYVGVVMKYGNTVVGEGTLNRLNR